MRGSWEGVFEEPKPIVLAPIVRLISAIVVLLAGLWR
jgi:hypothetical protein